MNNNIKVGIGFLIPASAIIFFIASLYAEKFLWAPLSLFWGFLLGFYIQQLCKRTCPALQATLLFFLDFYYRLQFFLALG